MKKGASQKKHTARSGILISSALGLCGAFIALLALLTIFSLIGLATSNPHSLISPASLATLYLSAFLGGFIAIKKNKGHDPLLCGLICGVIITACYLGVFFILGFVLRSDSAPISWLYRALLIPSSVLGSLLGASKKRSISKKRKKGR